MRWIARKPDTDPDDEQLAEAATLGERLRQLFRTPAGRVRVLLVVGTVALLAAGPTIYRQGKRWRAGHLARQALAAIDDGRLFAAQTALRKAFLLDAGDPRTVRAAARYYAAVHRPEALGLLRHLLERGAATIDDRVLLARLATEFGAVAEATAVVDRIEAEKLPVPPAQLASLRAGIALRGGNLAGAIDHARAAYQQGGQTPALALPYARLLAGSGDAGRINEAVRLLGPITDDPAVGREASLLLAAVGEQVPAALAEPARQTVLATAAALRQRDDMEAFLAALAVTVALQPDSAEAALAAAATGVNRRPPADQLAFARWLNQRRRYDLVLQAIAPETAATSEERFLVRLDALAGKGAWAEIDRILATAPATAIKDAPRHLFAVRAASELQLPPEQLADRWFAFDRAVQGADRPTALYCASYLERVGESDRAAAIYSRLVQMPGEEQEPLAMTGLLRVLDRSPLRTDELRAALALAVERFPGNKRFEAAKLYYDLLCDSAAGEASRRAAELAASDPQDVELRALAAFGQLLEGRAAEALRLFPVADPGWEKASPGAQFVRALLQRAAGDTAAAQATLDRLPRGALRQDHEAFLHRFTTRK